MVKLKLICIGSKTLEYYYVERVVKVIYYRREHPRDVENNMIHYDVSRMARVIFFFFLILIWGRMV